MMGSELKSELGLPYAACPAPAWHAGFEMSRIGVTAGPHLLSSAAVGPCGVGSCCGPSAVALPWPHHLDSQAALLQLEAGAQLGSP